MKQLQYCNHLIINNVKLSDLFEYINYQYYGHNTILASLNDKIDKFLTNKIHSNCPNCGFKIELTWVKQELNKELLMDQLRSLDRINLG